MKRFMALTAALLCFGIPLQFRICTLGSVPKGYDSKRFVKASKSAFTHVRSETKKFTRPVYRYKQILPQPQTQVEAPLVSRASICVPQIPNFSREIEQKAYRGPPSLIA